MNSMVDEPDKVLALADVCTEIYIEMANVKILFLQRRRILRYLLFSIHSLVSGIRTINSMGYRPNGLLSMSDLTHCRVFMRISSMIKILFDAYHICVESCKLSPTARNFISDAIPISSHDFSNSAGSPPCSLNNQ